MKAGDRVKWADAKPESIYAYRTMRGTVIRVTPHGNYLVQWDCDPKDSPTIAISSNLALAVEGE